jgi:hypothetical protein
MRLQFLALTALPALTSAAYCSGKPSPDAQPNLHPIMTPTPTIIRSVPNAVLQRLGTGDDNISVVHLWGSAYAAHRSRKLCAILWREIARTSTECAGPPQVREGRRARPADEGQHAGLLQRRVRLL